MGLTIVLLNQVNISTNSGKLHHFMFWQKLNVLSFYG